MIELIKNIFYFSEPLINIDDLERYISENSTINPESIAYLKDWLDKDEKNNSDEDNKWIKEEYILTKLKLLLLIIIIFILKEY